MRRKPTSLVISASALPPASAGLLWSDPGPEHRDAGARVRTALPGLPDPARRGTGGRQLKPGPIRFPRGAGEGSGGVWTGGARNPLNAGRGNGYPQHQGKSILRIPEQVPVHQGRQNQGLFIGLKIEGGIKINLKTSQEAGIMKTKVD